MLRRALILTALLVAASFALTRPPRAAEASTQIGHLIGAGFTETERARIAERLQRENFALVGETRRKGSLLIASAVQNGVTWRLVIESQSGEIIGRRPLTELVSFPR